MSLRRTITLAGLIFSTAALAFSVGSWKCASSWGRLVPPASVSPPSSDSDRRFVSIKLRVKGRDVPARLVDSGDAQEEVQAGDWAILKVGTEVDLPALRVNTGYAYEFAEPIFRLGNDYSKGIILGTGYVGQRTSSASPSEGCRGTIGSRSSCRSGPRCFARSRGSRGSWRTATLSDAR